MNNLDFKKLLLGTSLLVGFAAAPALAQDAPTEDELATQVVTPVAEEDDRDEVVVTGSRIKRDTFSSISPLQIIDFDDQRDLGLLDPVQILQNSEAAAGVQIDSSFSGFVLDNGPGSETIDLRGLGAERTLVLINGRRMAPAGVEGAPSQPSINLLPSLLIDRVEQVLDGASSVYGSDAVAGVINVLLKKDFEGFEVEAAYDYSEGANADDYVIGASYGKNFDRGFIGFGGDYTFRDALKLRDRDFLGDCATNYEITTDGEIRTIDIDDEVRFETLYPGLQAADQGFSCTQNSFSGRVFIDAPGNNLGSVYFVEGESNTGIPNFVDQTVLGTPIDINNDGIQDYGAQQFNINGSEDFLDTDLIAEQTRISLMAFGEYTMEGDANITPYFEVLHSEIETTGESGAPQLFPDVSAQNPFNPCGVNGVDCRAVNSVLLGNQALNDRFFTDYGDLCARFGFGQEACTPALFGIGRPIGPANTVPIFSIDGDRDNFDVSLKQTRLVGGFKGDIPFMNFGEFSDWTFDVSLSHSIAEGKSARTGVRGDRLNFSLGNNVDSGLPNGLAPCTVPAGETIRPDVINGCVPVNVFAASVLGAPVGNFATEEERNYLFDSRNFDTEVKQTVWNAFATGTIAEVPAGDINMVVGLEYRTDQIESVGNEVATGGLLQGFFTDAGTNGTKWVREAFAEVDIPVVADKPLFRQLDVNLSARVLEDEYYGGASVYSAKAGWRPFDSLLLKASYGTSFRSPNIRENFLGAQSGFITVSDPCFVPSEAYFVNPATDEGVYAPEFETRDQDVLDRCVREGVDPTALGEGGNPATNLEVFRVGDLSLDPEESTSLTLGASFEQPFTDAFDLTVGASYYNIKVKDEVVLPTGQFVVNDCFVFDADTRSSFCDNITRDTDGFIDTLDISFLNRDQRQVRGLDLNARLGKDFAAFDRNFEYLANVRANHILEVSDRFVADSGAIATDDDKGEFGFADWTVNASHRLSVGDFSLSHGLRFIDAVEQDEDGIDEFDNIFGDQDTGFISQTCGGPSVDDVNCRDVGFADSYMIHDAGVRYDNEDNEFFVSVSVRNIFDKEPPKVDGNEVTSVSNAPIGAGYDFYGRSYVLRVGKQF